MVENTREQRRVFFKLVFGPQGEGWFCLNFKEHASGIMNQAWFNFPSEIEGALDYIDAHSKDLVHFWFTSALYLAAGDRHRSNVKMSTFVHCDLDSCDPKLLKYEPSVLVQTSPGRLQAYWVLDEPATPSEVEAINTKIAYFHHEHGADLCHDAGHLLRIPYTPNFKYGGPSEAPLVIIITSNRIRYKLTDFSGYPLVHALKFLEKVDQLPELPDTTTEEILERYSASIADKFYEAYHTVPDDDAPLSKWSGVLFNLISICIEAGLSKEEIYIVCDNAECNKYKRDGRSPLHLWQDINRIYVKHIEKMQLITSTDTQIPELLTREEIERVQTRETFVERYIHWAKGLTDAPVQYHQAGAFTILSALLCGNIFLRTSHEKLHPNLWFMILAGTTLTRKSTAMRIPISLLSEVNPEAEMATDGSVEGLLSALQDRAGRPSIFLKDEFTGLLDQIAHKDYMAGFAEQLIKLYDGDGIKRLLRKEVINVKDPRFIILAAGIKDKTQQLLTEEHVMSGFVPRFVFITGSATIHDIKLTRPPSQVINTEHRELLKNELMDLYTHYVQPVAVVKNGKNVGTMPGMYEATLTTSAWTRFNEFEKLMMETAQSMGVDFLMPMHVRLTYSTLKAALLIAASRQREEGIVVDETDILHAIYYCQRWREYASEIVNGVGKTYDERLIDRIHSYIGNSTSGVTRAELMRIFQLDVRRADLIFSTMVQRNVVYTMEVQGQKRYRRVGVL